jgi:transcriptional regulator with XRE-family HTH domain
MEMSLSACAAVSIRDGASDFPTALRSLRRRFVRKQLALSVAVGCSDAAVSFWECGKRLPDASRLERMLEIFAREGATIGDLDELHRLWERASSKRSQPDKWR